MTGPLDAAELAAIDSWWRAANYLSVGQIYLMASVRTVVVTAREDLEIRRQVLAVLG